MDDHGLVALQGAVDRQTANVVLEVIKVSAKSGVAQIAGSISAQVKDGREPVVRAVGAGAVNQAVKAMAVAAGYVAPHGIVLSFRPGFDTAFNADGQELSVMTFKVIASR